MADTMKTTSQKTVSQQWEDATNLTGVTTASLLVVLVVSTTIGALVGLVLSESIAPGLLALCAGALGAIAAGIVRNTLLVKAWGAVGVADEGTPVALVVNAAFASFAGSLAADRIAIFLGTLPGVVLGALAGLFSALLLGLLMVVYPMNPDFPRNKW